MMNKHKNNNKNKKLLPFCFCKLRGRHRRRNTILLVLMLLSLSCLLLLWSTTNTATTRATTTSSSSSLIPTVVIEQDGTTRIVYSERINDNIRPSTAPQQPQQPVSSKRRRGGRFPKSNTPEFEDLCGWAIDAPPPTTHNYDNNHDDDDDDDDDDECIFYVTTGPKDTEGISSWTSRITQLFMLAKQTQAVSGKKCQIQIDYGGKQLLSSDQIQQVVIPPQTNSLHNWALQHDGGPHKQQQHYKLVSRLNYFSFNSSSFLPTEKWNTIQMIPDYRFVHYANHFRIDPQKYINLTNNLQQLAGPEQQQQQQATNNNIDATSTKQFLQLGMACSLNTLLHLSPTAAQFEPNLFTQILPTLQDPNNLVLALYIRTGLTDNVTTTTTTTAASDVAVATTQNVLKSCALPMEKSYFQDTTKVGKKKKKIIWMVITDNLIVKEWIITNYNDTTRILMNNNMDNDDDDDDQHEEKLNSNSSSTGVMKTVVTRRQVLVTSSRGKHTKPKSNPSLKDFAEAFVDWYLIGESDLVVSYGGVSFSSTASQRTNRPIYFADRKCSVGQMFTN